MNRIESNQLLKALFDDNLVPDTDTLSNLLQKRVLSKTAYTGENYAEEQESDAALKIKDEYAKTKRVTVHIDDTTDEVLSIYDACIKYDPDGTVATEYVPTYKGDQHILKLEVTKGGKYVMREVSPLGGEGSALKFNVDTFTKQFDVESIIAGLETSNGFTIEFVYSVNRKYVPVSIRLS